MTIFQFLTNSFVVHQCIFAESPDFDNFFFITSKELLYTSIYFVSNIKKIRLRSNVNIMSNKVEFFVKNKCSTNSVKSRLVYIYNYAALFYDIIDFVT